jgi:hypothetical protein
MQIIDLNRARQPTTVHFMPVSDGLRALGVPQATDSSSYNVEAQLSSPARS